MHGDIGAMDGLLKLAHAANVITTHSGCSNKTGASERDAQRGLKRAKRLKKAQILQEEREREKRQTVSMSSNDGSMQINEDGMHENSARAYSEALEQARENPGFLRRKKKKR